MISKRAASIGDSVTMAITAKAQQMAAEGMKIFKLAAGEPDFDTPEYIRLAGVDAINKGKTRYTPAAGTLALRKAVSEFVKKTRGVEYAANQLIITSGAKQAIANVLLALVDNPADEVIVPVPYWVSYPEMVRLAGATPVFVETSPDYDFALTPALLEKHLTENTRALILNSPSNPTGAVYSKDSMRDLLEVLEGRDVYVVSDEIYSCLVYEDAEHVSPLHLAEDNSRIVLVDGVSKAYAMTGWRLGFAAGRAEVIKAACNIQSHTTSGACSISQEAALAAYGNEDGSVEKMRLAFDERRRFMYSALCETPGVMCRKPLGAFYCFPDVTAYYGKSWDGKKVSGSVDLCEILLEKTGVASVPGQAFGDDRFIRFSYAASLEDIREAMKRFAEFLSEGK